MNFSTGVDFYKSEKGRKLNGELSISKLLLDGLGDIGNLGSAHFDFGFLQTEKTLVWWSTSTSPPQCFAIQPKVSAKPVHFS